MEKLLPVRQANPGVSARTEAAIAAAMALSSSQRLSNATALRNALAGRVVATPVAVPLPAAEPGGRRGVPAWLLAVVGLAAVAIIAVGVYLWLESRRPVSTKATDGVGETATPESEPTKDENEVTAATIDATTAPIAPTAGTPEQTETAELNVTTVPSDRRIVTLPSGVEVVRLFVPDGTFQMGSATNQPEEQPVHKVQLDSFWIDHTPVTNAQFEAYVNALGLQTKAERTNSGYVFTQDGWQPLNGANWRHPQGPGSNIDDRADHPVVLVTWEEARDYCVWSGGRLPTEAEWEYAARGPQNLSYPWGREFDLSMFNFCDRSCPFDWRDSRIDDGFAYTSPVDAFPQGASWMGAYDMLGNVWEWVQDWHDESYYAESPVQNPAGPESGALRVARGGGWPYEVGVEYAANRARGFPTDAYNGFGFRCAQDADQAVSSSVATDVSAPPTVTETPAPSVLAAGSTREAADPTGETVTHVYVPAGSFQMGGEDGNNDELPIHNVTVDAFWLDRTEVSNDRFAAFVAAEGYETAAERQGWGYLFDGGNWDVVNGADWQHPQGPGSDIGGLGDHPVVLVNRADAAAFCAWAGGRLPTEAEWEYAARGPENHLWAWGDEFLTDRVNFCDHDCSASWVALDVDDGYTYTAPVDSFPQGASWVGALNITGNVWEWVSDWYDPAYYSRSPQTNPPGPETGERGILRGGSWVFEPRRLRATDRNSTDPDYAINEFGIRCAYDVNTGN